MKEMPSHGASLRSSVHFEQTGLGGSPGSGKSLGDHAFKDAVVIDHQEPADRLAVLDLLPQPRGRRFGGLRGNAAGKQQRPIAIGKVSRNLDSAFRIVIT